MLQYQMIMTNLILLFGLLLIGATPEQPNAPPPQPTGRYWLYLTQEHRSNAELEKVMSQVAAGLTPRALARRSKVIQRDPPVRICDLPISQKRIAAIESTGCKIVRVVRYLNAVSVQGDVNCIKQARALRFVDRIRPVLALHNLEYASHACVNPNSNTQAWLANSLTGKTDDAEDFGHSWTQASQVNLPAVHDRGYRGRGVLIGVQDTGFDNLNHRCFSDLEVIAAYDFVNDDPNVGNEQDYGNGGHGTRVLSIIAGLDSGNYIGAAPEAEYVLTKTENSDWEQRVEEDDWVAGLWFHDSIGTEVLNSSLSYRDWYEYDDLDGETAVTTRAADSAAAAGIIIVNSGGNTGRNLYPVNKIGAPADGRFVITVGGVLRDSSHWSTSSQGPTYDRRIKPDVVTLSVSVSVANNYSNIGYLERNGTSFSCPMISGIAALMLEANHYLTPMQVMEILHETSSRADNPDTLMGYGIPDALAAVLRAEATSVRSVPLLPAEPLITAYPNPFNSTLHLLFGSGFVPDVVELCDLKGRQIISLAPAVHERLSGDISFQLHNLPAGIYYIRAAGRFGIVSQRVVLVK